MTAPRNTDLLIKAYLADGPLELPDRSFESVRDTIERTRQRRRVEGWSFPRLSQSMRLILVAALVLIALVSLSIIAPGGRRDQVVPQASSDQSSGPGELSPSANPAEPRPTAGATPTPVPAPADDGGTFQVSAEFPVDVTLEYPAGWVGCNATPLEQGVCGSDGAGVNFMIIDNVVADPCADVGLDPAVGPTLDDLAAAVAGLEGFEATAPVDIVVDGHPGVELTVTAPENPEATCSLLTWGNHLRTNGVGAGEANRLRIVDVDGVRVLVAAAYFPNDVEPDIPAEALAVLDSVRFP